MALGLLVVSFILLAVGGFIRFDAMGSSGAEVLPLGYAAAAAALASVLVAVTERAARRALGVALLGLTLALVVAARLDDGFRFVFGGSEGELFYLQVVVTLIALVLLTPRLYETPPTHQGRNQNRASQRRTMTGPARAVGYLCCGVALTFVAFSAGAAHVEASRCSGPDFDGECDVAVLEGLLWSGVAIVLSVVAVTVIEVRRSRRRRAVPH